MATITTQDIQDMVTHALSTPLNGYLGSPYGNDVKSLLQTPMSSGLGDALIDKLVRDVPILGALPDGTVNMYMQDKPGAIDRKTLFIDLNGTTVQVGDTTSTG